MVDSNKSFQIKCDPVSSSVSFDPSSTVSSSSTHHPTSSPPLPVHRNSPHHYPVQVNHYSHDNHLDGVSQVTSPSPSQQHQEQEQLHHLHQHQHHQPVSRYEKEYFSSSHSNYHTLGNHAVTHEHDNDDDQEEDQEYHNHEQFNAIVSSDCMSEKIYQENGEDKLSLYSPQPPPSPAPYASSSSTSTSSYKFIAHSSSASSINALTDDQRTNSNKRSIVSSNVTDQSPSPLVMASFTQVHDDDDDDDETHTMSPGQSYPTHPPVDANNGASHVNTDERVTTVTFDSPDDTCIEDSSINNNNLLDGRVSTSSQSASCTILPSSSNQTIHITVNPVDENDFNKKIQKQQQQEIKLYDKIKCNISNHVHKYNNTNRTTCSKVDSSQCADNSPSKSLSIDSYYITPTTQDTTTHGESVEKLIIATNVFIFCAFVAAIILAIVIIWLALGMLLRLLVVFFSSLTFYSIITSFACTLQVIVRCAFNCLPLFHYPRTRMCPLHCPSSSPPPPFASLFISLQSNPLLFEINAHVFTFFLLSLFYSSNLHFVLHLRNTELHPLSSASSIYDEFSTQTFSFLLLFNNCSYRIQVALLSPDNSLVRLFSFLPLAFHSSFSFFFFSFSPPAHCERHSTFFRLLSLFRVLSYFPSLPFIFLLLLLLPL